jgi:hypothetical protein
MAAEDTREEGAPEETSRSGRVLSRLAKRLQNPRELGGDAMEMFGALVESSDRVKTEAVRMVAREVRNYLEELKLKEGLRDLVTGHSLEVHVSLSLKPLENAVASGPAGEDEDGGGEPQPG